MKRMDDDLQGFNCSTIGLGDGLLLTWTRLLTWGKAIIGELINNILALPSGHVECVVGDDRSIRG